MQNLRIFFYAVSLMFGIGSTIYMVREQDRINHRLDARDAYFKKGLIDGAKQREAALLENRHFAERLLNHCRAMPDGCKLPEQLTILPPHPDFDSLETLLTRNKE